MPSRSRSSAYTEAGVNIDAGSSLVDKIKSMVAATHIPGVYSDLGGFGGLFRPDLTDMKEPVLVASTDGVGTKVKLACELDRHNTIGIDLVAMCVNDIIVQGARPLFFLDYFATGKLNVDTAAEVVSGIANGCKQAGCALLGGETAEMPGVYQDKDYDLAGFCVGMVDNSNIVDGSSTKDGNSIIGIGSSGAHSNGYSLIRKLLDQSGLQPSDTFPGTTQTVADVLIEPTIIYVDCVRNLLRDFTISGMAHITGGGFYENIPRSLPQQLKAEIRFGSWEISPLFHWLKEQGNLSWPEMLQIFNCGIGYVVIADTAHVEEIISRVQALGLQAWNIGNVTLHDGKSEERVSVVFPENM